MFFKLSIPVLILVASVTGDSKVNIVLSARELPNSDIFSSSPDPFVKVFLEGEDGVFQTSIISNQNNPNWEEVFEFNFRTGSTQKIRFEVWDDDLTTDDNLGQVLLDLKTIAESCGTFESPLLPCPTSPCGFLRINRQVNGENSPGMDARFVNPKTVIEANQKKEEEDF